MGKEVMPCFSFAFAWCGLQMHQEEKSSYMVVQTSEEGLTASGEFPGPLLMLAQNCAVMHNLLGPACIFLRKGFAENRQPVRKLAQWSSLTLASQGVLRHWGEVRVLYPVLPVPQWLLLKLNPQSFPFLLQSESMFPSKKMLAEKILGSTCDVPGTGFSVLVDTLI